MISSTPTAHQPYRSFLRFLVLFLAIIGIAAIAQAGTFATPAESGGMPPFFSLSGSLNAGQSVSPSYPHFGADRPFNFSLTATNDSLSFAITDGNGMSVWSGTAAAGETIWGYGALAAGSNQLAITNTGASTATYALNLYDTASAPYTWAGQADASGVNSAVRVQFATAGLYTFNTDVTGGRFQLLINSQHVQKTITASTEGAYTYFIPAGTHTLTVKQDASFGAGWSVDISAVGATANTLPTNETGGQLGGTSSFDTEWFPVYLAESRASNIKLMVTGTADDSLQLMIKQGGNTLLNLPAVYSGETTWATTQLPTGLVMVSVMANGANVDPIAYDLTLDNLNNANSTWSGSAHANGANSTINMNFQASGLYTFDLDTIMGGYQIKLDDNYILRTAWADNNSTHYVSQGIHRVTIIQDTMAGADWSANISLSSTSMNTLPFNATGANLSGLDNDFNSEWFPVVLDANSMVNMKLTVASVDANAMIDVAVYNPGSITPNYLIEDITAQEAFWGTFNLMAGSNRIRVTADGTELTGYALDLIAIPTDSSSWAGTALGARTNNYTFQASAAGLYRFQIDADPGFANLDVNSASFLDNGQLVRMTPTSLGYTFDRELSAGIHTIQTLPDANFITTTWAASVMPISPASSFFSFDGTMMDGDTIIPQYELPVGPLDINFAVEVNGSGPVDLTIQDSTGTPVWVGSVQDGEKLWGNTTLAGGLNRFIFTNNSGNPADVQLTAYPIPDTDFAWDGVADAAGSSSQMLVTFDESGLYAFNFTTGGGRYQFNMDNNYIRKTVEGVSSDTFFVPAGTHEITVDQDSVAGADWSIIIIPTGLTEDTLPYTMSGGALGGGGNDFNQAWLPIHLVEATEVNISLNAMGMMSDTLLLHVFSPSSGTPILTMPAVYGGETIWDSFQLPAGTNYIHVVAAGGNTNELDFEVNLEAISTAPDSWTGQTSPMGQLSEIRMNFPTSGLYTFNFGVMSGNYEFQINSNFIQKNVYTDTTTTLYVPAGTHTLGVNQDATNGADWDITVISTGSSNDSLPYNQMGMNLMGAFNDEWLTLNLGAATEANIRLEAIGDPTDRLIFHIFDMNTGGLLYTINPVHGGEIVWNSFDLPTNGARIQVVADGGNVNPIGYDLQIDGLPTIINHTDPSIIWAGTSYDIGLNSGIRINTHLSGTYHIEVSMAAGFTNVHIDEALPFQQLANGGTYYSFDVPFSPGQHTLISEQDTNYAVTDWVITATLMDASAPTITSITPDASPNNESAIVTIDGVNFMPGTTVTLRNPANEVILANVTYVSASQLTAVVPTASTPGVYDVIINNPDGKTGTLTAGYEIFDITPVYNAYIVIVFAP